MSASSKLCNKQSKAIESLLVPNIKQNQNHVQLWNEALRTSAQVLQNSAPIINITHKQSAMQASRYGAWTYEL
jgi:hypothetical protein